MRVFVASFTRLDVSLKGSVIPLSEAPAPNYPTHSRTDKRGLVAAPVRLTSLGSSAESIGPADRIPSPFHYVRCQLISPSVSRIYSLLVFFDRREKYSIKVPRRFFYKRAKWQLRPREIRPREFQRGARNECSSGRYSSAKETDCRPRNGRRTSGSRSSLT